MRLLTTIILSVVALSLGQEVEGVARKEAAPIVVESLDKVMKDTTSLTLKKDTVETIKPIAIEPVEVITKKSPFPLEGTVLKLDIHDIGVMAAYITFYNDSRTINGFTGHIQLVHKGEVLLDLPAYQVDQKFPAEENTPWYGALNYDPKNKKEASLLALDPGEIEVKVLVESVVNSNGVIKSYK